MNSLLMKKHLGGMYWSPQAVKLAIPYFGDAFKCAMVFKKNLAEITWNSLRTLEKNPTTLPQTQTILAGQSVGGLSVTDLLQVKNYGDGARFLTDKLRTNSFVFDKKTLCDIHRFTRKEDALTWGSFRTGAVTIQGSQYTPPPHEALESLANDGFAFLNNEVLNPKERAIASFLFLSRSQFFFDANKRTASLVMNGILASNGYLPITFLSKRSDIFHKELGAFYESGNADALFSYFSELVQGMYSDLPKEELRGDPFG